MDKYEESDGFYEDSEMISELHDKRHPGTAKLNLLYSPEIWHSHSTQVSCMRGRKNFVNTATSRLLEDLDLLSKPKSLCLRKFVGTSECPSGVGIKHFSYRHPKEKDGSMDVIALVLEVLPIEEIWTKSGKTWLPKGTAVLRDVNGTKIMLTLWGRQCRHLFHLEAGHVVGLKRVIASQFRQDQIVKLTKKSQVCHFGYAKDVVNMKDSDCSIVNRLRDAIEHIAQPLPVGTVKVNPPTHLKTVHFCNLNTLKPGIFAHVRVKITFTPHIEHSSDRTKPFVVTLHHPGNVTRGHHNLMLHGSCRDWIKKLKLLRTHTWELYFVACAASHRDDVELHTTVLSFAQPLFEDCDKDRSSTQLHTKLAKVTRTKHFSEVTEKADVQLASVCTESIFCTIKNKRFTLTKGTPEHLLRKTVEKYLKSKEYMAAQLPIKAECYLKKDVIQSKFVLEIIPGDMKVGEISGILSTLLQDVTDVIARQKDCATTSMSTKTFIFQAFAK